ncbi:MAG: SDR family oxidoreductase [Ectothiorhodospiraceae bacterium]|nr:SDR family oxidoreductase [Chromatiales bacterium]MCP5153329.1 SDR family oxidoreductase [Ectothiorhodospiraceae bacterium]
MPRAELAGQRVAIIGGTRGIGHATAALALEHGAEVLVASRDATRVAAAVAELGALGAVRGAVVDVTARAEVDRLLAEFSPIDHLCLPGSQAMPLPYEGLDESAARAFFDAKFWGPFWAVHGARDRLRPGGSVVLYSGAANRRPLTGYVVGAAIDGAIDALTRSLAATMAERRVRVNCISPGIVDTDVTRRGRTEGQYRAWVEHHASRLPVGRIGRPQECAAAALYLMTNGFVNGQVLAVDGGLESVP